MCSSIVVKMNIDKYGHICSPFANSETVYAACFMVLNWKSTLIYAEI